MNIITVNNFYGLAPSILKEIQMKQDELAQSLSDTAAKVEKIGTETRTLLTKIDELTTAVTESGDVSPEVQAALETLQAQVETVDQLVPDA